MGQDTLEGRNGPGIEGFVFPSVLCYDCLLKRAAWSGVCILIILWSVGSHYKGPLPYTLCLAPYRFSLLLAAHTPHTSSWTQALSWPLDGTISAFPSAGHCQSPAQLVVCLVYEVSRPPPPKLIWVFFILRKLGNRIPGRTFQWVFQQWEYQTWDPLDTWEDT